MSSNVIDAASELRATCSGPSRSRSDRGLGAEAGCVASLACSFTFTLTFAFALFACTRTPRASTPREMPTPSVQVGSCGQPGVDGVVGQTPKLDRADRDLDGDGVVENIVVDRAMCTPEGNCYWNVFRPPPSGSAECSRYAGTFAAAALEPLGAKGEDNMSDVRGYWNLHGGRLLLQSYRFVRGGYQLTDALLCKRAADDRLDCTDSE